MLSAFNRLSVFVITLLLFVSLYSVSSGKIQEHDKFSESDNNDPEVGTEKLYFEIENPEAGRKYSRLFQRKK